MFGSVWYYLDRASFFDNLKKMTGITSEIRDAQY